MNAIRRGGEPVPLLCGARGCTVRHGRREALEAAVQVDPGLRVTAARLQARPDDGEEGRRDGLCCPWDQNTLGIAGSLDDVRLEDLQQRFVTVIKVKPGLASAHAKLNNDPCAWPPQSRLGRASPIQTIAEASITLEVEQAVVHPPGSTALAGWPNETAQEACVCRTRQPRPFAPVVNGVYPSNNDEAKRPSPRRAGRQYVQEGLISMPPLREGGCGSTQPPRRTVRAGERGNVGARENKVPGGAPDLRPRSCIGGGGSKFLRSGERVWSQLAPGGRI